jgi:hypothetical protein
MPASWLRRRRLGRLGSSVISGLMLVGGDIVERLCSRWLLYQSTHSMVAYSTSSMVCSGPVRNGLCRPTASVLNNPIVVSARALSWADLAAGRLVTKEGVAVAHRHVVEAHIQARRAHLAAAERHRRAAKAHSRGAEVHHKAAVQEIGDVEGHRRAAAAHYAALGNPAAFDPVPTPITWRTGTSRRRQSGERVPTKRAYSHGSGAAWHFTQARQVLAPA